jgi:hypothetical protein
MKELSAFKRMNLLKCCDIGSQMTHFGLPRVNKKRALFTSKINLELRKKLVKCYIWSMALYGSATWTLRAVGHKHVESFEMWCLRRMEKISLTDHMRNEVLLRVKE